MEKHGIVTCRAVAALLLALFWHTVALAQVEPPRLGDPLARIAGSDLVRVFAQFTSAGAGRNARLQVTADIAPGYHIYSLTQPPGGPEKTTIVLEASDDYRQTGPFEPDRPAQTHVDNEVWVGVEIQQYEDRVVWTAPLELAAGVDLQRLTIAGSVEALACDATRCVPVQKAFVARLGSNLGGSAKAPAPRPEAETFRGEYRAAGAGVVIRGRLEPRVTTPGGHAELVLTAEPDSGMHVYALADGAGQQTTKPTLIVIDKDAGLRIYPATTQGKVVEKNQEDLGLGIARYHEDAVTWTVPIDIPSQTPAGQYTIGGIMGYQVCSDVRCLSPTAVRFQGTLVVGEQLVSGAAPIAFTKARYRAAAELARSALAAEPGSADAATFAPEQAESQAARSLGTMLLLGFAGGLILNLMPCVLPVIGLKVMSFVEQSGHSRARAMVLNIWYALGLLSVFLVLAALAVGAGMTWGEQFGSDLFNIVLTAVVFALALSLLGVWEIPIPGFVGGGRSVDLAEKEGPAGAFMKGVITTVLATPCTGPFMGTALAWAVRQPPATTYAVFASMGVGMASPYLLIGAFPGLLRWLPKPGAWMVLFKQIMGFVLLGTVVFLLTFMHPALVVPTVTLLAGIGAACWWINRTPGTAPLADRITAWAGGIVFATAVGLVAFGWLDAIMAYRFNKYVATAEHQIPLPRGPLEFAWRPFTAQRLEALVAQDKTVLVDFSADWCLVCKTLEKTVLHTAEVKEVVERNGVITLYADYTRKPPEVKKMLRRLQSNGVPVIAIFPPGNLQRPIVFRGSYTKAALLAALEKAGPSRSGPPDAATAMRER